jgi:hypothetical protein
MVNHVSKIVGMFPGVPWKMPLLQVLHSALQADFYKAMDKAPLFIFVLNLIEPAMEVFLCLTGFLATLDLVPKLEGSAATGKSYGSAVTQ